MVAHHSDCFFFFGCGAFTDGWSRETCPRWFTAVYKWRSAVTDGAIHNPLASSHNHSWAQTDIHKHTSMHTAAGQAAVENICRGQDAHMSMSLYAVFAFLQIIYISRKTYSFTHPPDAEHRTHKNTHMATISVCACQFLLCCLFLLSCPGSKPGENTGSTYWAVLSEPTLEPMTY